MIFLKISQPLVFNCHVHLEINRKMELWNVFMALAFTGVSKSVFLKSLKDVSFLGVSTKRWQIDFFLKCFRIFVIKINQCRLTET